MPHKDPAFLFYPDNFLVGVGGMADDDIGKYIRLLCYMHQKGHLEKDEMKNMVGKISRKLWTKFRQDENGLYYNERLDEEMEKRGKFLKSRADNGRLGGRGNKSHKPSAKPSALPNAKPSENLVGDGNGNGVSLGFIKEEFNRICVSLPKVSKMTDKRAKKIKLRDGDIGGKWTEYFERVEASDFMTARIKDPKWQATFDWLIECEANVIKVLEGNYDNKVRPKPKQEYSKYVQEQFDQAKKYAELNSKKEGL